MEKILIITGGNKGLGLGLSKFYNNKGYHIISISRDMNGDATFIDHYPCDLSKHETIKPVLNHIFSHIDKELISEITLINNAGYLGEINTLDKLEPAEVAYPIQLNLIAPLVLTSTFIDLTRDWNCKKQIFNISSGAAVNAYESWAMYCSSKAGLDMMTKVVAKEQDNIENGVSIASIYPGIVDTNMQNSIRSTSDENFKHKDKFVSFYEEGKLYSPEFVAEKIYKLDTSGKLPNGTIIDIRNT
ncbi:MAG TPA: SDR family NAD(P)-dependent oxidoreductase [Flavobacteriaceae bacterium]|nr:SDR family NAD(P)-dependent oxidoreductase [Flavobacteriaceae bacterium]